MSATLDKPESRRHYHHGDLCRACVHTAMDLLDEGGLDAVTLRAVAERTGVSRSAPYRHFETKRALLAAVATEGFRRLTRALEAARDAASGDAIEQLVAGCVAYVRFGIDHPQLYRLMFAGDLCKGPLFGNEREAEQEFPELAEAGDAAYDVLVQGLLAAQKAHLVRDREPTVQALSAWAAVHGVMSLYLDNRTAYGEDAEAVESVARAVIATVMEGLRAPD